MSMAARPPLESDVLEKYKKAVKKEFDACYAKLSSVVEGSMQKFAEKARAADLISVSVMRSKNFDSIATDFLAGLDFKDRVLDIQQHCQCFIDILEDLGGPAIDAAKHLSIRWSTAKFLSAPVSTEIQYPDHSVTLHEETKTALDLMRATVDRIPNLAKVAYYLEKRFAILCISAKEVLKAKSVHLEDAKLFVRLLLDSKLSEKRKTFHASLEKVQNFDEFFIFLHHHHFLGYLNYDLLKTIAELAKDENINKQFDEYEKEYIRFLQDTSFSEILAIFHQYPDLKPTGVIGLPQVSFHLDSQQWSLEKISDWNTKFGEICGSGAYQLKSITKSSILITYVVFPSALPDVLRDLKDSVILKKFENIGVSVQLPELTTDPMHLSEDMLTPFCTLPDDHEVADTCILPPYALQQHQPIPTHRVSVQPKMVVYQFQNISPEFEPPDYLFLTLLVCMICGCLNVTSLLLSIIALILSSMTMHYKTMRQYVTAKRLSTATLIFIFLTVLWVVAWAITIMAVVNWYYWFKLLPSIHS